MKLGNSSGPVIGIDAGNSLDRKPTGVAVYTRNLIRDLAAGRPDASFGWFYRANRYLRSWGQSLPRNACRYLLEEPAVRLSTRRMQLFHGLNQRLPAGVRIPKVATFHDLFALTGEYSTREFRARFAALARETAIRADRIIAVSHYTADQVAEHLGYDRSRITVVHHGVEPLGIPPRERREAILDGLGVKGRFVLQIGALQVRKNIERVVEAFESCDESMQLVLAGSHGYRALRILEKIRRSPAGDRIVLTGHVPDEVRATLYASAEALLFPSLEEGFGIPVIEAFAAGLPVIASNVSAIPEVAEDAALLVSPRSVDEIAGGMERLLGDPGLQETLRAKGLERAKRFSWQKCAAETWRVYEDLLEAEFTSA